MRGDQCLFTRVVLFTIASQTMDLVASLRTHRREQAKEEKTVKNTAENVQLPRSIISIYTDGETNSFKFFTNNSAFCEQVKALLPQHLFNNFFVNDTTTFFSHPEEPIMTMHQRPLRSFVTRMMNQYAIITKKPKNKPGYNQPEMKPSWWPSTSEWYHPKGTIQYANVDSLRAIVRHCFNHFGIQSDFVPPLEDQEHDSSLNSDISPVSSPAQPPSPSGSVLSHNSMDVTSQTEDCDEFGDSNENRIGSRVDDQVNLEDLDVQNEPNRTEREDGDEFDDSNENSIGSNLDDQMNFEDLDVQNEPTFHTLTNMDPYAAQPNYSSPTEDIVIVSEEKGHVEYKPVLTAARVKMANKLGLTEKPKKIIFGKRSKDLKDLTDKSKKKSIGSDGSCFFRSINFILTGSENEHMVVREAVVKHMGKIKRQLQEYHNIPISEEYLQNMNKVTTWATHVEIIATANLLEHDIVTFKQSGRKKKWFTHSAQFSIEKLSKYALYLDNVLDNHYEVVLSI